MTRDVRVTHVLGALRRSGAEQMLLCAVPRMRELGIQSTVISLEPARRSPAQRAFLEAGMEIAHLSAGSRFGLAFTYLRELRRQRPDCVHIHAERLSIMTALIARLSGAGVVRTVHANFDFGGLLRNRKRAERWLARRAGVVHVAVSPSVASNELSLLRNPACVIDNWYDDLTFRPPDPAERVAARTKYAISTETCALVVVGNCAPVKNHTLLLQALLALRPTRHVQLLHAGDDSAAAVEKRLAAEMGDLVDVRFLGTVDDVAELLWAGDIFVMPSEREGLGLAAIEAAATGIRCVVTDVPGLRDVCKALPFVMKVAPNVDSLLDALEREISATTVVRDRREPSAAARHYGVARGVDQYVELYRRVSGQPGAPIHG